MANTLPSIASVKHLAGLVLSARSVLPRLESFSTIQTITTNPERSAEIPIVTDIGTVQTSSFDYEASDVMIDNLPAVPQKFCLPFSVGSADMQNAGLDVRQLVQAALEAFEAAIWDTSIAPLFAETNFTSALGTAAVGFNSGDFETLLASVSGRERAVVLDTDYAIRVKPTWLPVTPTTVSESSRWTAAGDDVKGFVAADRRGIVAQVGLPLVSPNSQRVSEREIVTLPGLGIQAELTFWNNTASKAAHACLITYFAAVVGDASAVKLLKASA